MRRGKVNAAGSDVKNVGVSCLNTSSIVVTVTGLAPGGGLTLSNGTTLLAVAANGTSAFPGVLAPGTSVCGDDPRWGPADQPELHLVRQLDRNDPGDRHRRGDCGLRLTRYFRFRSSPPM